MYKRIHFSLLLTAVLSMMSASAAERPAIELGAGAASCQQYAQSYARNPDLTDQIYFSWAQGFMTGWNVGGLGQGQSSYFRNLAAIPIDQQHRKIREYCNQHPSADFDKAVMDLYMALPMLVYKKP